MTTIFMVYSITEDCSLSAFSSVGLIISSPADTNFFTRCCFPAGRERNRIIPAPRWRPFIRFRHPFCMPLQYGTSSAPLSAKTSYRSSWSSREVHGFIMAFFTVLLAHIYVRTRLVHDLVAVAEAPRESVRDVIGWRCREAECNRDSVQNTRVVEELLSMFLVEFGFSPFISNIYMYTRASFLFASVFYGSLHKFMARYKWDP